MQNDVKKGDISGGERIRSGEIISCGYCIHEKSCPDHDPKTNKAKAGCTRYRHFSTAASNK